MIAWLRRNFHVHGDRNWELDGVNAYYECRCGARRVRRAFRNLAGPTRAGWPTMTDRHGMPTWDSGWVRP